MSEKEKKQAKSNYAGQEHESLRVGTQGRLAEKVVDAKHDQKALDAARKGRFDATGEPSQAPCYEDVK